MDEAGRPLTIYDVLRHLVTATSWARPGEVDFDPRVRQAAAVQLIDRLEAQGMLGQTALEVVEVRQAMDACPACAVMPRRQFRKELEAKQAGDDLGARIAKLERETGLATEAPAE